MPFCEWNFIIYEKFIVTLLHGVALPIFLLIINKAVVRTKDRPKEKNPQICKSSFSVFGNGFPLIA